MYSECQSIVLKIHLKAKIMQFQVYTLLFYYIFVAYNFLLLTMITNKTSLTTILFSVMVIFSNNVHADDLDWFLVYNNLYVQNPNGVIPLNISNLRTLSFGTSSERMMKATYKDNHIDTISTTVIDYIYFGSAPTKVENVSAANTSCILLSGNTLTINTDKAFVLTIYSIDGKKILSTKLRSGANSVSVVSLLSGMYIARTEKSTFKFCR